MLLKVVKKLRGNHESQEIKFDVPAIKGDIKGQDCKTECFKSCLHVSGVNLHLPLGTEKLFLPQL